MLRISKIVDYGILVLTHLASRPNEVCSTTELAAALGLGQPVVSKALKLLAQHDLVVSTRGAQGGYQLQRDARLINIAQVIDALEEQPFGLTECTAVPGVCSVEDACHIRPHWIRINRIVRQTLESVALTDMLPGAPPVDPPGTSLVWPAAISGAAVKPRPAPTIPNWSLSK